MPTSYLRSFPSAPAGDGISRRVLAESPELMLVEFSFAPDAVSSAHSHPHLQATFVASGRFEFTIDGETFAVGPGDAFVIPSGAVHSARAFDVPGVLVDSFAPRRDDFL